MPHAALWVVQPIAEAFVVAAEKSFQCRTRLCGWCSTLADQILDEMEGFNAARGFVGGAA